MRPSSHPLDAVGAMVLKLVPEDLEGRLQETHSPVGIAAGAAAPDLARPALEALEVRPARTSPGDSPAGGGQGPAAEKAGTALGRALPRPGLPQASGLADP